MNELKKALLMPLEGVWDYRADYTKYFRLSDLPRHSQGKAIFLWYGDRANIGYAVYIGAGLHESGKTEAIVTGVGELFMDTDKSGIPQKGSAINGEYTAGTSSDPRFATPDDTKLEFKDGEFTESSTHNISEMRFTFQSKTRHIEATVIFKRPRPQ